MKWRWRVSHVCWMVLILCSLPRVAPVTVTAADRSGQVHASNSVQAEPAQPAEIRIDPLDPYKTFSPEQVLCDWPVYAVCPAAQ